MFRASPACGASLARVPFAPRRGGCRLALDVQGGIKGGFRKVVNFVHPLRAALRLPASPSLREAKGTRAKHAGDARNLSRCSRPQPPSPLMPKGELKGV